MRNVNLNATAGANLWRRRAGEGKARGYTLNPKPQEEGQNKMQRQKPHTTSEEKREVYLLVRRMKSPNRFMRGMYSVLRLLWLFSPVGWVVLCIEATAGLSERTEFPDFRHENRP